jgi:hypothetical protein
VLTLGGQSAFAVCASPASKTYSGYAHDELYYISSDGNTNLPVWGRKFAYRWVFSPISSSAENQTVKITGFYINASDGGHAVLIDGNNSSSTLKATYTFNTSTCSGVLTISPKLNISLTNTAKVFFQVAGSGASIHFVNQNTPTDIFIQPSTGKTTLLAGGTLNLE